MILLQRHCSEALLSGALQENATLSRSLCSHWHYNKALVSHCTLRHCSVALLSHRPGMRGCYLKGTTANLPPFYGCHILTDTPPRHCSQAFTAAKHHSRIGMVLACLQTWGTAISWALQQSTTLSWVLLSHKQYDKALLSNEHCNHMDVPVRHGSLQALYSHEHCSHALLDHRH